MTPEFIFGGAFGVGLGNMVTYKFLFNRSWMEALGGGLLAAIIFVVLSLVFSAFIKPKL